MFWYMRGKNQFNKAMERAADIGVLVDAGGGTNATLEIITCRYKHMRGINFDLPHAHSEAPAIPGRYSSKLPSDLQV